MGVVCSTGCEFLCRTLACSSFFRKFFDESVDRFLSSSRRLCWHPDTCMAFRPSYLSFL
jgi:hypothetical protein